MADRFEDVRTFVAVVEGQGFNAAARRLGLVKSAVSRRVRDLEDRLGTRLVNRTTRRLSLTEAGAGFYERGVRLLADLREAEDLASTGSHEAVGRLRVSAPVSFTVHCLAPTLGEFADRNPRLELEVEANDRLVDLVGEGFDLAIRISRLRDSSLVARRIAPVRHVACASPAYLDAHGRPGRPAELEAHRGAAYLNVDPRQYWMFRGGESVAARTALWLDNGDALREAAVAGCGIVVLPTFIAYRAVLRGDLEIVLRDHMRPPIALHAVYPSSRNVPAKVRLFIDFLVARFSDEPFWDRAILGDAPLGGAEG